MNKTGNVLTYHGPLPIDGEVTVVEWEPEKWKEEGLVGNYRFRPGLIPVFSNKFPETKFWWVHPNQLKPVSNSLNEDQILHGENRLKEFADLMGVDEDKAVHILLNVQKVKAFYNWVNAPTFLANKFNKKENK